VQDAIKNDTRSKLTKWVDSLDGRGRVSRKLGMTLYRYEHGQQEVPKWLIEFMKMSEEMAKIKQENAILKRGIFK
jgi:hypothetical protein